MTATSLSGLLSVLFIGGTGTISTSCVRRAVADGLDVSVLNRGRNDRGRSLPDQVSWLQADIGDRGSFEAALEGRTFDVVVNFLSFTVEDARLAVELLRDRVGQYVHISSASIYRKPIPALPIVESTLRDNPFVAYSRDKIAVEDFLMDEFRRTGFPVTIVRPSHTYDETNPPVPGGWTVVERMLRGDEIVVHGDGTSLWTLTHASDFAVGLVGLLGDARAIGEDFHITSQDIHTWHQIYTLLADSFGVTANLVHVPSEFWVLTAPDWLWSQEALGDLGHSAVFDTSKLESLVPNFRPSRTFPREVRKIARWYGEHRDPALVDDDADEIFDRLARGHRQSREIFESLAVTP